MLKYSVATTQALAPASLYKGGFYGLACLAFILTLLCGRVEAQVLTHIPKAHTEQETTMPSNTKHKSLSPDEARVILHKGTEAPYSGEYVETKGAGTYHCKQCDAPLYRSTDKFDSGCGWPSFDTEIPHAVRRVPDADGQRTEIICASCGGHLGHVFEGEGFTAKNTRHCVNSISMVFVPTDQAGLQAGAQASSTSTEARAAAPASEGRAIFAGGCFWGVEDAFQKLDGVRSVTSGYTGGTVPNPRYEQVSGGRTGHAEAVEVLYDPAKVSYETLARLFFEIHDPTQLNRQGPDVGTQYRSAIFYTDSAQKSIVESLIRQLESKGWEVVTQLAPATDFYPAEDYHQDFTARTGRGGCHLKVPRFEQGPSPARGIF